ncbi:MAG: FtsQ-type POTRA domain-containing protein [Coriobacteriia bacterium]|nr:FtsQ-type POTRA domain-containing protein [Coriobacteriia bacterium]
MGSGAARSGSRLGRWFPRILIALVVLVVIGAIGCAVARYARIMPIEKVTVSGASHLTNEELTQLAAVPADSTLFNVDTAGIEGRLESNPWVKNATVERVPPDAVNLNIEERGIAATVDITVDESATVETWALSSDGIWLTKIPSKKSAEASTVAKQVYTDAKSVLKISDVPLGTVPEAGAACTDVNVKNALGIVSGMTTELAGQVKYVSASSAESTTLVLQNGIEIAFGDDTNIRDKERVCLELMKEHEGSLSYINVRTVSNPIWRSLK